MASVVEGVDDEVLFTFLFLVISCVLLASVFLRSRRSNSRPAANRETARETETDHSTTGFGTQTNSSTEQVHVEAREADADSEGIRRRFGAQDNSRDLSREQNIAATTTSDSASTDTASCGGSSCATSSKSNNLTNTADKNLSDNTNNSFGHGTCTSTDTGPSTTSSLGTDIGSSTTSSHGTNSGPSTTGSLGTSMGPSTTSSHGTSTDPGRTVTIRVKYLETERSFTVDMFMKVQELKRLCYPTEINQGRTVRLIYSGRLLVNDEATLSYYGIGNYSVIHAQISNANQSSQSQQGQQQIDDSDIDMGQIFLPLLTIILCGCWYGLISYRNMFSTMSAAILVVLTGAYTVVVYAMIG